MKLYTIQLKLPDKVHTILESILVAANFQQAMQLAIGMYGKRVSILSITEKD